MKLPFVNPITLTHAEADAVQQAIDDGQKGSGYFPTADLYADREPCRACGPNGGLRSLARELGVGGLRVHSTSGTTVVTPKN